MVLHTHTNIQLILDNLTFNQFTLQYQCIPANWYCESSKSSYINLNNFKYEKSILKDECIQKYLFQLITLTLDGKIINFKQLTVFRFISKVNIDIGIDRCSSKYIKLMHKYIDMHFDYQKEKILFKSKWRANLKIG